MGTSLKCLKYQPFHIIKQMHPIFPFPNIETASHEDYKGLISITLVVTNLPKISELVSLSSASRMLIQLPRAHPNSSLFRVCLLQISPHP